jgi:GNAT superfamily N-acetyltransferase
MTAHAINIVPVKCSQDEPPALRQGVKELFKAYFDELYERGCDVGFQGFQNEWSDLPGKDVFEKRGGVFVAVSNDPSLDLNDLAHSKHVVGCIAIRPLNDKCGEVKRMFIRKSHRRNGIGKLLAETIVQHAWELEYEEIKLDSLERLTGAVKLYEAMGFQRIDPYCECPEEDHVCMNLFSKKEE